MSNLLLVFSGDISFVHGSLAGRPFIVELTNPRRVNFTQEDMTNIQTRANDATKDIRVTDLQIVSRLDK